jgi:hypothetical protein
VRYLATILITLLLSVPAIVLERWTFYRQLERHKRSFPAKALSSIVFLIEKTSARRDGKAEIEIATNIKQVGKIGSDSRCVRIFNERTEQVGIYTCIEPGKFSRNLGCRIALNRRSRHGLV